MYSISGFLRLSMVVPLSLLLFAGCATRPASDLVTGPACNPANVYGANWRRSENLRRVAVLPVLPSGKTAATSLDACLQAELRKAGLFEIVPVSDAQVREWLGHALVAPCNAIPEQVIATLRDNVGCDGVLVAEVTAYNPYPPLAVGWRLRLFKLASGTPLWAADEVFDASEPGVSNGARKYHRERSPINGPLADSSQILLTPTGFSRYTLAALLDTIE